ncbi:MAG TPA: glutathione S-transferase family protein [Candidatus Binataceae bacterium]|nr:glutathione S-transferase family protein [Candidatus Binataceae bacterium]
MAITMYDLVGAEPNRRFSPFCWRTKLALAHKGLEVETIPWHFTDKQLIAKYNWERVPVIVDNGRGVVDSWAIANYLEDTYPQKPSLFGAGAGRSLARFYNQWADAFLHPAIAPFVVLDVFNRIDSRDRDYFRQSREARFGTTLEAFCADREQKIERFRQSLEPLRQTLAAQPYLSGEEPLYPDYIVFGSFLFPRSISPFVLLESADPINQWRERLLDRFNGMARKAPGYW